MKKRYILFILIILFLFTSCNKKINNDNTIEDNNTNDIINDEEIISMKAIINNIEYVINLENNNTVNELIKLLPLELEMVELNGNEKYAYLNKSLPTNSYNPNKINKGDVMLYGSSCIVIFYETFNTSYSYTKIGHIDNLGDLGSGSINVKLIK